MKKALFFLSLSISALCYAQNEHLVYHDIKTDDKGNIVSWYSDEPGKAWSHVIQLVWNFWDTMRTDMNGLPYYMNHQVWKPNVDDARGIGGDQIQMALSSWRLLYAFTGDERIKENMKFMADYYISHGFSSPNCEWPNIPFPYNSLVYSGVYDGDMVLGKNYTQPDKAGSLGNELIHLYKMNSKQRFPSVTDKIYLETAIKIANTLAKHTADGNLNTSPLPFKVNALTGETGKLKSNSGNGEDYSLSNYTSNWGGTMELFLQLIQLKKGNIQLYQQALDKLLSWIKQYPLKNNRWGPFFEDIPGWSDTQINAVTMAQFIMNHQQFFSNWKSDVKGILNWVYATLKNESWKKYGVIVVNEQTVYQTPGNSHTSREASAELQYVSLSGDTSYKQNAIRQLNWATYMVNNDGKNCYPYDENWLTDGYGDYVRHYLRAMAAIPELSPSDEEHILSSTSVIQQVVYKTNIGSLGVFSLQGVKKEDIAAMQLYYRTYDNGGKETIRLNKRPSQVLLDNNPMTETKNLSGKGYSWKALQQGGLLTINRVNGNEVIIK